MNILYIAIDTLRADHLGCYGHDRPTSPHLDALAARGVRFADHISPHIPTHPGYTTMFTGMDVLTHQIVTQGGQVDLAASVRTLPQILQRRGYFTAAADNLGRWFNRGYDLYEGYNWAHEHATAPMRKAEAVNETALRVLDACDSQDQPWFCFLHYWDPHTPYLPPPPFDRMFYAGDETSPAHSSAHEMMNEYPAFMWYFRDWMPGLTDVEFPKAQYDAEIAYVDAALAHVFSRLQKMKSADTAVIVTSDHGEELDEHQMWFDHHGLYETNLHVPLIMWHPERLSGGEVREGLTSHVDVAPTVLDLAGLGDAAAEEKMEGRSLACRAGTCTPPGVTPTERQGGVQAPALQHDSDVEQGIYITECGWMKKRGFRTPRYKFIESLYDELHHRAPFELYDLQADPGEQHNLADSQPELLRQFRQQMADFLARRTAETGLPDPHSYQEITMRQVGSPPAR